MALVDKAWYVNFGDGSTTGYYAVTQWAAGATIAAGALRRQLAAPAVNSGRVFVCIVGGTTHATTEPTWVITRGGKTTDNTVTWQECTGVAALNGDATNTPSWTITATPPGGVKNTAVTLGQVIKRDSGDSYQICTTAGTAGNGAEPSFSNTAGTTTADNTVTWTSLGAVGNFTGWQAPHARLRNAFTSTWGQQGNSFFVASEHVETQTTANMTLNAPGAADNPCFIYCVNKTNVPPTSANLATGASCSTTTTFSVDIGAGTSFGYYRGLAFISGSGANNTALSVGTSGNSWTFLDACSLSAPGTSATAAKIIFGNPALGGAVRIDLNNTTMSFGNVSDGIAVRGERVNWKNTAAAIQGANVPTTLFQSSSAEAGIVTLDGVDLSALGAGATIVGVISAAQIYLLNNCKLGASVTVATTPSSQGGGEIYVTRSDSGATNYRAEKYQYMGTQTVETTIVRTGGASDGTTSISWKLTTTANSKPVLPFESVPLAIWNDTVGLAITVTVYGVWGGGAVPKNDEIWLEARYLGSASTPLGSLSHNTKADFLATGTAQTADTSTWGGSTTPFKMTLTFTPQMKGYINILVKAAKVSTTFYIDPKPELS